MGRRHLIVVLAGNVFAVAQPVANHVRREALGQFGLPAASQVVEQPRPGRQAGALDDPLKLGPQVAIPPAVWPLGAISQPFVDHVHRAIWRLFRGLPKHGPQFGE